MGGARRTRIAVPVVVIGLLVWLMVGCLYVPTWERVQLRGTQRDFRGLVGPALDEAHPIVAGWATRPRVEELLGPPPFATADGRSVAYMLTTRSGLHVVPLCLAVGSGHETQVAVRLEYGPDGVLKSYEMATATHDLKIPIQFEGDGFNLSGEYLNEPAIEQLGGDLRRTAAAPTPHPLPLWRGGSIRAIVPPPPNATTVPAIGSPDWWRWIGRPTTRPQAKPAAATTNTAP